MADTDKCFARVERGGVWKCAIITTGVCMGRACPFYKSTEQESRKRSRRRRGSGACPKRNAGQFKRSTRSSFNLFPYIRLFYNINMQQFEK